LDYFIDKLGEYNSQAMPRKVKAEMKKYLPSLTVKEVDAVFNDLESVDCLTEFKIRINRLVYLTKKKLLRAEGIQQRRLSQQQQDEISRKIERIEEKRKRAGTTIQNLLERVESKKSRDVLVRMTACLIVVESHQAQISLNQMEKILTFIGVSVVVLPAIIMVAAAGSSLAVLSAFLVIPVLVLAGVLLMRSHKGRVEKIRKESRRVIDEVVEETGQPANRSQIDLSTRYLENSLENSLVLNRRLS